MTTELKGRYADYYTGDKANGTVERTVCLSLNAVKTNFGADIAKAVLHNKRLALGNTHWFELVLIPGEKTADETAKEKLKLDIVKALYQDLRESYPSMTYAWLIVEADRLIAGGQPAGGPSMFLNRYLTEAGLLAKEV